MRTTSALCASFFAIVVSACCNLGTKSSGENSAAETTATPTSTEIAAAHVPPKAYPDRAAINVSAKEIIDEYKNNEVRADGKYKDKVVEIRGLVEDVKKDITDSIYVTVGTGAMLEIPIVQCFIKDGEGKAAAALNKGDLVTVVGHVDGLLMNVLVKDCTINPDLTRCERLRAAMGGSGKCEATETRVSLRLPDKSLIHPMCFSRKDIFDLMMKKDVGSGDKKAVNVYSERSLCLAIVGSEKGVSPVFGEQVKKALDSL